MTSTFDRLDLLPDAAFLLWVAVRMVAVGLVIGAFMAARWARRWVARGTRRHERLYRRIEEQQERVARRFRELDKDRNRRGF